MGESNTLQDAISGDTTSAAEMWRSIAAGKASEADAIAWLGHVATRVVVNVLDADLDAPNRRADAALKAIGFYGRVDKDRELRAQIEYVEHNSRRKMSRSEIVGIATLIFKTAIDDMPIEKAVKKIDRVRKK